MELLLALLLVAGVALFVTAPLRRPSGSGGGSGAEELADLDARKESLYRQIRDAEADRTTGKISASDHDRIDAELRAEAISVLKRIDALEGGRSGEEERHVEAARSGEEERPG